MRWIHHEPPRLLERAAYTLFVGALALTAMTGYRAWSLGPVSEPATDAIPEPRLFLGERVTYRLVDAVRAVERDPFHPERRAPLERYLLPEADLTATVSTSGLARGAPIRLLGTAVSGSSGGFAMCQIGGEPPKMLRVGDTLGGLTLRSIARAAAEFTDARGESVTLRLPGSKEEAGL